ncbi:E3 ubiquitin-protein ligase SINA-like 11 [Miscanthus floridulus]|uniref:E3 ubiquitin-protein ligase SINA-like 11 n=1 Tax=Miscanthus floridulus TaxID=154761 RepID=UPI00345888A3
MRGSGAVKGEAMKGGDEDPVERRATVETTTTGEASRACLIHLLSLCGQGEGALVAAVVQAMEEPQINIRMAMSHLHCHACVLPLKPPTFECEAGHVVCRGCRGSHVQACAAAGTYVPCAELDGIVRDAKVACAYEAYSCTSWVVYYEAPDHHRSCRFAPCFCPVPGCGHFTSPARLAEHFFSHHAWPVTEVDYAKPCKLAVPGPEEKLVLMGKADGSVFLVSPCAFGAATAVSLVCVRACGDAAAGAPQYTCNLWAEVAGNALLLTSVVASSDLAGGFPATDKVMFLPLPPLLYGESGEPPALMARIDKVGASTIRSRSPSATPPSSLPRRMLQ